MILKKLFNFKFNILFKSEQNMKMSVLNTNIIDKINGMTTIKLSRKDFIGKGSFADVYLY